MPHLHHCPECGAPLPEGAECQDLFHALLVLEAQVPEAPGGWPHFFAVSSYVLQHPIGMNMKTETLDGLRASLADALDGRVSLQELRLCARRATNGSTRVTRRPGDPEPLRHPEPWPLTVADVCAVAPEEYAANVREWARSVRAALEPRQPVPAAPPRGPRSSR
jgi:hypothetical protein